MNQEEKARPEAHAVPEEAMGSLPSSEGSPPSSAGSPPLSNTRLWILGSAIVCLWLAGVRVHAPRAMGKSELIH